MPINTNIHRNPTPLNMPSSLRSGAEMELDCTCGFFGRYSGGTRMRVEQYLQVMLGASGSGKPAPQFGQVNERGEAAGVSVKSHSSLERVDDYQPNASGKADELLSNNLICIHKVEFIKPLNHTLLFHFIQGNSLNSYPPTDPSPFYPPVSFLIHLGCYISPSASPFQPSSFPTIYSPLPHRSLLTYILCGAIIVQIGCSLRRGRCPCTWQSHHNRAA